MYLIERFLLLHKNSTWTNYSYVKIKKPDTHFWVGYDSCLIELNGFRRVVSQEMNVLLFKFGSNEK